MQRSAFTVIELLIVISILAVLTTSAIVSYQDRQKVISFGNAFSEVVLQFREARNLSLNSLTTDDGGTQKVPIAYGLHIDPTPTTNGSRVLSVYADFKQTTANPRRVQFCFDRPASIPCGSENDPVIQTQVVPSTFSIENAVWDPAQKKYVAAKQLSLLFVAPFADPMIVDESPGIKEYKRMQVRFFDPSDPNPQTVRERYICVNSVGGIIDERNEPCT